MALRTYNATSTVSYTVTAECEFCGHVHDIRGKTEGGVSSTMGAGKVSRDRAAAGAAKQAERVIKKLGKESVALRCPKCGRFPTRYMETHFPEGFRKGLAQVGEVMDSAMSTEGVVAGLVVGTIIFGLLSMVGGLCIADRAVGSEPPPLGRVFGWAAVLFCGFWGLVVWVRCRRSAKRKQAVAQLEQRVSYLPDEVIEAIVVHEYMGALGGVSGYSQIGDPYFAWAARRADILRAAEAGSRPDADPKRIRFKCTSCRKELVIASSAVGGNVKCPECAASTGVPPVPDASLLQIAPEAVTEKDVTTLFRHLELGNAERVWGMLTVKPAVATAVNEYGFTPIEGVKSGPETLWLLAMFLENGADINGPTQPPLLGFAAAANRTAMEFLLDRGADVNAAAAQGIGTALHQAANSGRTEAIELLVERGADVNAVTSEGRTALHLAARSGRVEVLKLLIEKGADLTVADANGDTPLGSASQAIVPCPEAVSLLLGHMAQG
jgi:hypothetical protein